MEPEPPFFAWSRSRSNLVGAGVGTGTSDFRSRPKKWRLRNTVIIIDSGYRFALMHVSGTRIRMEPSSAQCEYAIRIITQIWFPSVLALNSHWSDQWHPSGLVWS